MYQLRLNWFLRKNATFCLHSFILMYRLKAMRSSLGGQVCVLGVLTCTLDKAPDPLGLKWESTYTREGEPK